MWIVHCQWCDCQIGVASELDDPAVRPEICSACEQVLRSAFLRFDSDPEKPTQEVVAGGGFVMLR
jgi:hypothetical protein